MKKLLFIITVFTISFSTFAQNVIGGFSTDPSRKTISLVTWTENVQYVGLTLNPGTKNQINLRPIKVGPGRGRATFDVSKAYKFLTNAKAVYSDATTWSNNQLNKAIPFTSSLWKKKIGIIKCTYNNGPCTYCKRKGFHLEGRGQTINEEYHTSGKVREIKVKYN